MLRSVVLLCLVLASAASAASATVVKPVPVTSWVRGDVFDVTKYGAVGDGKTDDTEAIRAATTACAAAGGGTVLFPHGYTFLTGPFNLTSHSVYSVQGRVMAIRDHTAFYGVAPLPSYHGGREGGWVRHHPVVFGFNVTDVTITGGGTIDGNGDYWWKHRTPDPAIKTRPRLIECAYCRGFTVEKLSLQNSPFWTLHPVYCDGVVVRSVRFYAPPTGPETDCIDPDSSRNVLIEDCDLSGGDDCIAIKSGMNSAGRAFHMPAENIVIRNNRFHICGGVAIGSEESGDVRHVRIYDNTFIGSINMAYLKAAPGRGGVVEDVDVGPNVIDTAVGMMISMHYSGSEAKDPMPVFRNIHFHDITGKAGLAGDLRCHEASVCHNITVSRVDLQAPAGFGCHYITGHWDADTVHPTPPKSCLIEDP